VQIFFRSVVFLAAAIVVLAYLAGRDVATLPHASGAVTFVDRTGLPLGTLLGSDARHAVATPLADVSPGFLRAVIAAEDGRFYEHGAVDVRSLARAMSEYVVYGRSRSGGSTITMQLARLLHPSPATFRGKLVQIVEAERIAMRSEPDAILAAYVNRVPMGGNLYGVESAARTYFGSHAGELDLAHAALLAAIPNDPAGLAPDEHPAAARARRAYVLAHMVALGDITPLDASRAAAEPTLAARHDSGITDAAHALFYLYPGVRGAGLVRTTLDRSLQRFVQGQILEVLAALGPRNVTDAAALVVDNHTGDVLAYAGSPDYFSDAALGRNDGVQALRQPGSSLKPFTYELALERGTIDTTMIVDDAPASFAIADGKLYQPADYSGRFSGPVTIRYALANSLNVPAVRVLSLLGPEALLDRMHELGFMHDDKPASYYGLGLTLGGAEVSLWENVHAYVTMARLGDAVPLRLIAGAPERAHRVGAPSDWAIVTDMLADPLAREHSFGRGSVLDLPFDAAVKTGTSSDFRDTWTIGFTRDYTVGVWAGNFDGSAMRDVSGVTGAGPLWNRIMLHLHERAEPARFAPPAGFARATICATTGHAPERDCPAVVQEWVAQQQFARVARAVPAANGFHITAPSEGAVFYRVDPANALQDAEQRIALQAAGARGPVAWTIDGRAIPLDAAGNAFVPLRVGRYAIEARNGASADRITIVVRPAPQRERPGLTFSPRSP
jgi:penicillin-binding protein 1C